MGIESVGRGIRVRISGMTGYGNIQSKQRGMRVLRRTAYCEASAILERVSVRALVRTVQTYQKVQRMRTAILRNSKIHENEIIEAPAAAGRK